MGPAEHRPAPSPVEPPGSEGLAPVLLAGGTMGFYDPSDNRVPGRRWVVAGFDDGHITGRILLRYEIGTDETIRWQVVDGYLR